MTDLFAPARVTVNPPPPRAYLDHFNAQTDEWLVRIGARASHTAHDTRADYLPGDVAEFVNEL